MPPSNHSPHRAAPPTTKIKSLKLQFRRNPNSQPASPAGTPPPAPPQQQQQQPVASSSRPQAKDKDKAALALAKRKKKQQALDRQAKKAAGSARHSPAPTLLTAGTSSRPQVHQIVRKPAATVFAAEPTAGFDDDGNSTLSELSSADGDDEDDQPVAGPSSAGTVANGTSAGLAADDDEMEEEPRWDEEYNGAWERRRGSFPSDDDDGLAGRGSAADNRGSSASASDDDMDDDDDSDMNGLSGSEHSDGIRVLSFDATGARVLLGGAGLDGNGPGGGGGWSEDSSEADDEEEELWFEDYEQFGTMEMDVDASGATGADQSPAVDGTTSGGPSTLSATPSALVPGGGQTTDDAGAATTTLGSAEPSTQPSPTEHELDTQAFDALQFLADDADVAAGQVYEDLHHQSHHDGLHMLEDFDGQLIFSALADALGSLGGSGPEKGSHGVFQWATESEGDSDGSKDAARMDDLWSESDTDGDHYFGDEEGDTTDSLPDDEVDEAIKRSLLEEEDAVPTPPSLALSASLVRQLASTGSDTYSSPSLVSPALSASKPVPLVQPVSSAIASPMEVAGDPSPPLPRPIARSPSIVSEAATVSSAGDASRPRPAPVLAALRKAPSAPPTMGCFIPAPSPARFKSVIIDGAGDREGGAPPPTPFARRKSAEKNGARSRGQSLSLKTGSTGRKRDRHNKVKHPFVPKTKRTRYGSMTPARMSPRPPLREETPSSPDVEPVSLEDVLDTSLFHHGLPSSTSDPSIHATSTSATDRERFLADHSVRNLRRWDRVSIGTFRGRLGGGSGGVPSRGAFGSQTTRPAHHAHNHIDSGGLGGRPASQGYDHSPSKGSIFRSEQELEAPRGAAERTLVMSPVIAASGAPAPKGKQRELEGFVL